MDHNSDIWGDQYLTLNRIWRQVGAVGETTAIGEVGVLGDTIEDYFPLGVGVHDIDEEYETSSYKKSPSRRVSSTSRKGPDNLNIPMSVGK